MARIVWLILNGRAENALALLSEHFNIGTPSIKVGLPKGRRSNTLGCYSSRDRTISVLSSDTLREPFVIIHEFYHHLRTSADARHRGTEKHADEFAKEFIEAYKYEVRTRRK